jgi:hypothetical protein
MSTTINQTEYCPHCGERLLKISRKLNKLDLENEHLREELAELVELLEHIEVHTYVGSSSRAHFHRPECKWARDIPPPQISRIHIPQESSSRWSNALQNMSRLSALRDGSI